MTDSKGNNEFCFHCGAILIVSQGGLSGSLHSSKTWGRLTLIEKNLDYSDSFQYPDFFCLAPFMSIN